MAKNILLIGASGHAKVIIDMMERAAEYRIAGIVSRDEAIGASVLGYPVLGSESDLPTMVERYQISALAVAVGDNFGRQTVVDRVIEMQLDLPFVTITHPDAKIAKDTEIGEGTVVMAGAIIGPSCRVGRFCCLNTQASLDHDSTMGDFACLAPHVVTGGNCNIGEHAFIGIGSTLFHCIDVGPHTVIGGGSIVNKSVDGYKVAYGNPARIIRERKPGDRYL